MAESALLTLEAGLGIWLVTGYQLRPAAAALGLGPALALVAGPVALGECANLAAVAAFLLVLPPSGQDQNAGRATPGQLRLALLLLRVGVGTALVVLTFSEKLTNPAMAIDALERFPALDVFALVGVDLAPETFLAVAGGTELHFGLLVVSGALPQVAVLVAMVPFNATLLLFGQPKMVDHLPVYGVFLALLVYGSSADTAADVRWLPASGAPPGARPGPPRASRRRRRRGWRRRRQPGRARRRARRRRPGRRRTPRSGPLRAAAAGPRERPARRAAARARHMPRPIPPADGGRRR